MVHHPRTIYYINVPDIMHHTFELVRENAHHKQAYCHFIYFGIHNTACVPLKDNIYVVLHVTPKYNKSIISHLPKTGWEDHQQKEDQWGPAVILWEGSPLGLLVQSTEKIHFASSKKNSIAGKCSKCPTPPLAWWALKRDKNTRYYTCFPMPKAEK